MVYATKQSLAQAFYDLLRNDCVGYITVTGVCERAGVSRVTFYNHFSDIYALVEWIYRDHFQKCLPSILESDSPWIALGCEIRKLLDADLSSLRKESRIFDRSKLISIFEIVLEDLVEECLNTEPEAKLLDQEDRTFLVKVLTYSASGIMLRLVSQHGAAFGLDDTMQRYENLVKSQTHVLASQRSKESLESNSAR